MSFEGSIMRIGIVTDIHLSPAGTPPGTWHNSLVYANVDALLDRAIAYLAEQQVDAVAVLGDLGNFGDAESIARGVAALSKLTVPVYIVAGNHDALQSIQVWKSTVKFENTGQVSIPNGEETGTFPVRLVGIGDIEGNASEDRWSIPAGSVTAAPDEPLVVLVHFPLVERKAEIVAEGFKYAGGFQWHETGDRLRTRTAPTIVLHGHLHIRHTTVEGTTLQLGFAALIEPPHDVSVVDIETMHDTLTVRVEHHSIADYDVPLVPVLSPETSTLVFQNGIWENM